MLSVNFYITGHVVTPWQWVFPRCVSSEAEATPPSAGGKENHPHNQHLKCGCFFVLFFMFRKQDKGTMLSLYCKKTFFHLNVQKCRATYTVFSLMVKQQQQHPLLEAKRIINTLVSLWPLKPCFLFFWMFRKTSSRCNVVVILHEKEIRIFNHFPQ